MGWFDSIEHNRWLSAHMQALIAEAEGAIVPTGFAHLDTEGRADPTRPIDLAVTGRMAYVFSLGVLMGLPGSRRYADHAVNALTKYFPDPIHGGQWISIKPEVGADGHGVPWDEAGRVKSQYHNAFAILGAAAAAVANRPGAHELLGRLLEEQKEHWIDEYDLLRDQYDEAFTECPPVRSMAVLVHTAEAYMAAAEATTEPEWLDRAEKIAKFTHSVAKRNNWRLPEYFTPEWEIEPQAGNLLTDGRRVYTGYVTGRSLQWARFALQIRAGDRSTGWKVPEYLMEMSTELFERARFDGWRRTDGCPGFATGIGEDEKPIPGEDEHQQWIACEGICAAVALRRALLNDGAGPGDVEHFEHCYRSFVDYVNDYLITQPGRWIRRLGPRNEVVTPAKSSRWDVYHGVQAMLALRVPLWPPTASALSRGLLDHPEEPVPDKKSWNFFGLRD